MAKSDDTANEAIAAAANAAGRIDHQATTSADDDSDDEEVVDTRDTKQVAIDEAKEIFSVVAVALILVMILRTFLFQPFTIPSASMEPNLYEGDYIIVSKWDYGISKYSFPITVPFIKGRIMEHAPKRGDIVVFKLPRDNKTDYIKRVIGLPGDTVQMRKDQLYINGKPVPNTELGPVEAKGFSPRFATAYREQLPDGRTHLMQDMVKDGRADDTGEFIVPAGQYFMMGDNRDNSLDSRFSPDDPYEPGVGFVPAENLEGRAVLILMSWKEGSSLWKPWTWLNFHWDRFFKSLH
ncbi:signal peptidase I [Asticcacaulis sp. 201]|uniref:signal peptidase I n=1 Tax=Asticcacaulis sp. 201 TaxID=3028787 RepID=UPI002915FFDD|nr:signal peptidase I [Asticcacaulis sp. 201]MDV6329258.1 signal peptidase I [Asticcacaulis sp. 201]